MAAAPSNRDIARQLKEVAKLMALQEANSFKIRAYENAAEALRRTRQPVATAVQNGERPAIEGIGKGIWSAIEELVQDGRLSKLDELRGEIPDGIIELAQVPGLGPKKLAAIWKKAGITTQDELMQACEAGQLQQYKGFGAKTQAQIYNALLFYRRNRGKLHLPEAIAAQAAYEQLLRSLQPVEEVAVTGDLRRHMPVVETLAFVVQAPSAAPVLEALRAEQLAPEAVTEEAPPSYRIQLPDQEPALLYIVPKDQFSTCLFNTSTLGVHYEALAPYLPAASDEAALYDAAGMDYVPPEARENVGELALAQNHKFPKLLTMNDLRGILHAHSTYSDGVHSLQEMAEACREAGYSYLGITDHSQAAFYANGLSPQRVRQQQAEIQQLNQQYADFRIFSGIEADILPSGELDYGPEVLQQFDFVIGSIHSQFNMSEEQATNRLISAVQSPYLNILGHPTGRLLLNREGYSIDHERVLQACAAHHVSIEINANPWRLDLDWHWLPRALALGIPIAIGPDAHSIEGLQDTQYGVMVGRKGLLTPEQTLNCMSAAALAAYFQQQHQAKVA